MHNEIQLSPPEGASSSRPKEVLEAISQIKGSLMENTLRLGRLLKEARDNHYNHEWGYHRFDDWVETSSGLDLSARSAYYLIKVVERAEELEIPDEDLHRVKLSKLKAIFSLPADTDPDVVKGLVKNAEEATLASVQEAVGVLKNQEYVFETLKLERNAHENVYLPALERVRREYGNTVDHSGNADDITNSRAIEMLCADKLSEPELEEFDEEEILEADFVDIDLTGVTAAP